MDPLELGRLLGMVSMIGIIVFVVKNNNKNKKNEVVCDGCLEAISGQFIRTTEEDLTQPLNYCSAECKADNFPEDRLNYLKNKG